MYSVVDAMLLRPPPFEQPDRLVILFNTSLTPGGGRQRLCWSFANITGMEHIGRSFDGVGSFSEPLFTVSGRGEPEHVDGETASREYVQALRIRPVAGRLFTAQESAVSGAEPVALIGERLWKRTLAGDPAILDRRSGRDDGVDRRAPRARVTHTPAPGIRVCRPPPGRS